MNQGPPMPNHTVVCAKGTCKKKEDAVMQFVIKFCGMVIWGEHMQQPGRSQGDPGGMQADHQGQGVARAKAIGEERPTGSTHPKLQ
eukprot:4802617-Karenia_brevis.AAC.1